MAPASAKGRSDLPSDAPAPPHATALRCLCLAGPTASGKTAAAMAIAAAWARHQRVEIVSVDSALVYRGMDIGTAKPSADERAQAPHHLIDLIEPTEAYSAAQFVSDALRLINEINSRGALPLLVGGTMLYFRALFAGLHPMPAADPALRAIIDEQAAQQGWPALHAELATFDPVTARRLAPNDAQRIQRALEVFRLSGRPLSSFHLVEGERDVRMAHVAPLISLEPQDRAWLHERIARRFEAMLAEGLVDEVRGLRARGDLHPDLPSVRCVGYRQAWHALEHDDLSHLQEDGTAATRQLAKRQLTWLRSMPQRHRVACDDAAACANVVALATQLARELPPA
jgi:tRNA dimethylallyltransferase